MTIHCNDNFGAFIPAELSEREGAGALLIQLEDDVFGILNGG
jgi:hypothetical protein